MGKIFNSQSGQSLVQVMMVAAVGVIIALGIATVMTNMQLSANSVKYRSDGDNFNEEMRALLSSPVACTNSFGGLVVGPAITFNVASIFDGSPAPGVLTYSAGNTYGDQSILLNSMVLANYQIGGAPNTALMTLTNNLTTKKRALGAQNLVRTINISLQVDNSNKIITCIALAKMSDGIWQRSQANTNNIFFNGPPAPAIGGNVGIGTTSPAQLLDVSNLSGAQVAIQVDSASVSSSDAASVLYLTSTGGQAALAFGSSTYVNWGGPNSLNLVNGSSGPITFGSDFAPWSGVMAHEWMRITSNGNVGIGTAVPQAALDVNGGIRLGRTVGGVGVATGAACSPESAMAYDSTAHSPVYCSQAGTWTSFGCIASGGTCVSGGPTVGSCISTCNQNCNASPNPIAFAACTQNCPSSCGSNICPPQDTINNGICVPPQSGGCCSGNCVGGNCQ